MALAEVSSQQVDWARELAAMSWQYRSARALQTAHQLGVFACLDHHGETGTDELAGALGADARMLEKLLIVMAAMGLLSRDGDRWSLTDKAAATLCPDAPLYQGHAIAHMMTVWDTWHVLPQSVRGQQAGAAVGPPKTGRLDHEHVSFIMAMHSLAMAGRADAVADLVDLGSARNLLDVGGGPGTYTMALLDRYPDLQATLFDLPQTIAIARANIERFGMSDRLTLRAGNWHDDEFGDGFDAVLMSNILHGPNDDTAMKLGKARDALKPGGLLIVQDFLMNDQKTGPLLPALFNLMVGAWSLGEMVEQVAHGGFDVLRHVAMAQATGQTLVIARRDG